MKNLIDARRPLGRLLYLALALLVALLAVHANAQAPQTTQIADVVYRPDGTPAQGTLLISWPSFTTADNKAVAAGSMSVPLGPGGAVTLALVPNEGATPAGIGYTVAYRLSDGSHSEEYWSVPAAGPTTIGAIRSRVVPANMVMQVASRQYVDGQLAPLASRTYVDAQFAAAASQQYVDAQLAQKASDAAVVHNSGNETVAGIKTFASSPAVPAPAADQDAANKAYVDANAGGQTMSSVRLAHLFAGTDACAKMAAAAAALPATGGTVDARGLDGPQTCAADPFAGVTKPVTVLLGAGTLTTSARWSLVDRLAIIGAGATVDTGGSRIVTTGAIWALQNPTPATTVKSVRLENFTIDLSANTSALGGVDWTGVAFSKDYNLTVLLPTGGTGIIGYQYGAGGYYNDHFGPQVYAATARNTHIGVAIGTNGNENRWYGGLIQNVAKPIDDAGGTGGNNGTFHGVAIQNFQKTALNLQTSVGVTVQNARFENTLTGPLQTVTLTRTANVVTASFPSGHNYSSAFVGGLVAMNGAVDSSFNGTTGFTVLSVPDANTITYSQTAGDASTTVSSANIYSGVVLTTGAAAAQNALLFPYVAGAIGVDQGSADASASSTKAYTHGSFSLATFAFPGIIYSSGTYPVGIGGGGGAAGKFRIDSAGAALSEFRFLNSSNSLTGATFGGLVTAATLRHSAPVSPTTAGGTTAGSASLPYSSAYIGAAATNNIQLTGTATGARVATLPDNTGTIAELNLAQTWTAAQTYTAAITSTVATGTAPLSVASTTPVANLTLASDAQLPTISTAGKVSDSALSANVSLLGATVSGAELGNPAVGTKGGVEALTCSGSDKLSAIGTNGVPVCSADQGSAPLSSCESYRSADLALTANTYADNVSCSLTAGTWLVIAENTVKSPNNSVQKVTVKLWDGTTVYSSGEEAAPSQGTGASGYVSITLSKIVTLASTTTVKTSVASTVASTLDATPDDNGTGATNTANSIRAVRIGN